MKNVDVQRLYTNSIDAYHRLIQTFGYQQALEEVFSLHRDVLKPNMRVLDAGCGSGAVTKALLAAAHKNRVLGTRCYGFDLTPAMLERFGAWITADSVPNVQTVRADVLNLSILPPDWTDYNLVVSSGMLEYVPRDLLVEALKQLKGRLFPLGMLLIFISRKNFLNRLIIEKWWRASTYTKGELAASFADAGFKKIRFLEFSRRFAHLNLWGHIVEAIAS